ncbi:MAG: hypothetical protein IPI95_03050 [Flavobacteriales bacterium]|nr:hypothetical protein [Flavobacteriales bacterium]
MKLDRHTYEAWLLDRLEGRLSPAQEALLDGFLVDNPDLPISLVSLPGVGGGDMEFPLKELLRKAYPPTGEPDAARLDDFLVARLEKDLTNGQEKKLERYLYEHPETDRQAALIALAKVSDGTVPFAEKETLERHFPPKGMPDAHRLTDFLIADLEGDLTFEQRSALKRYIAEHGEAIREERLVAATHTVLVPIPFPGKEGLKKREVRVVALWPRLAAAACFLLLIGAGWWQLRERPSDGIEVARVENSVKPRQVPSPDRDAQPVAMEEPDAPERSNGVSLKEPVPTSLERPAVPAGTAAPKPQQPTSKPVQVPEQTPVPKAAPATKPTPEVLPVEEPVLAQQSEGRATLPTGNAPAEKGTATQEKKTVEPSSDTHGSSQDLGTFVANTLRGKVLETPERKAELDGSDVLAFADKAIGAVTGGQGGMDVQHTSEGKRFQLRLGRNFSVSASRGR